MSNKLRLTILAAISIIVGMLSFSHFKYAPPTLVIDMRTSKGGYGQVYWNTGDGYSETNSRKFPLKSSEGFEVYKIPLPSETLTAVRIDPMVSTGTFEIRKIMVEGSGLSSEWSGKNLVRDLVALQNVEYRTDTPSGILEGTATTNDPSIEIRGFPADILERATATRLKRSLLIVLCFLIMAFLYQNRQAIGKLLSKIPRREAITLKISRFADFAITNIFPFLMSIYLLSFWIPPRSLDGQNEIDGSWNYALGKFRQLNLSFGKDSWFTYGPVSQWFGPALPPHNFYPWPFYVLAIFIGLLFFVSLRRIVKYSDTRVFAKTVAAILFSVSLVLTLRNPYEASLEVTTVLTFTAGFLLEGRVSWWLFPLMMLSSVGLLFKFSVGVLASVCFFIVLFYSFLSHCITLKRVLALLVAFLCLTELLFFFSSGSFDIVKYFGLGWDMSTKYSEIMISTGSWHTYEIGLLLAATWMFLGALAAGVLSRQKAAAFFLGLSISLFLVLKQGLVRADWSHIRYQMVSIMAPCIVILFLLAYSSQFRISTPLKLSSLIFFALLMLIVFYKYNGILTNQEGIISMYADSWKKVGSRLDSGLAGQDSKRLAEQIANVRSRHESLFSFLEGRCQTLRSHEEKASIMFYPWESIFAEVVPDCRWQPSPSLQIYAAGPCTKIQHMDADLLASAKRPEIVVIGAGTIDHRNSVSEYSGILAQLFHNYHVSGKIEDYVVLESDKGAGHFSEPITCSEKPKGSKGEFLRLKLKSLGTGYVLLWRIATFLFKAPELTVEISARDRQDGDITFSFRGYLSQLRQGVYVSNDVVDRFIFKTFRLSDNMLATVSEQKRPPVISDATALVTRNGGLWNIPIIPKSMPLQVEYCSFEGNDHHGTVSLGNRVNRSRLLAAVQRS